MAARRRSPEILAARAELKQAERDMRSHARTHGTAAGVAPGDETYYALTRGVIGAARKLHNEKSK